ADISLVPRASVDLLGVTVSGRSYEVVGVDGKTAVSQMVRLDLLFLRRVFKGQFLLIDRQWGILGRNIVNYLAMLLDGPNRTWRACRSRCGLPSCASSTACPGQRGRLPCAGWARSRRTITSSTSWPTRACLVISCPPCSTSRGISLGRSRPFSVRAA